MIKKTKNKKAWLRIVEATISILLILGVAILLYQTKQSSSEENIQDKLPVFLDEIAKNNSLRKNITDDSVIIAQTAIESFLADKMNRRTLNYTVVICNIDVPCSLPSGINPGSEIFTSERIISTTIEKDNFDIMTTPKKVKIYAWRMN